MAIAEIEMIRSRIIKIDCAFYETKTEKSHIEIQISLRIAGDRSDVMKSRDFAIHQGDEDVRSNSPRRFGVNGPWLDPTAPLDVRTSFRT